MAYPKKEYPKILFGIIKSEKGFSLCSYLLNEEKRVKLIEQEIPEVLFIVLERLKLKAYAYLEREAIDE